MIHNLKLVCPCDDCYVAISYDPEVNSQTEAVFHLGKAVGLIAQGGPPICKKCGSVNFKLLDVTTPYATMEEALPALAAIAIEEMRARDRLAITSDRN